MSTIIPLPRFTSSKSCSNMSHLSTHVLSLRFNARCLRRRLPLTRSDKLRLVIARFATRQSTQWHTLLHTRKYIVRLTRADCDSAGSCAIPLSKTVQNDSWPNCEFLSPSFRRRRQVSRNETSFLVVIINSMGPLVKVTEAIVFFSLSLSLFSLYSWT